MHWFVKPKLLARGYLRIFGIIFQWKHEATMATDITLKTDDVEIIETLRAALKKGEDVFLLGRQFRINMLDVRNHPYFVCTVEMQALYPVRSECPSVTRP